MDEITSIPFDVILGFICVLLFGLILGALISLPILQRNSKLPIERLSGDIIWRYSPDWIIFVIGCIVFLALSFLLISGMYRM